MASSSAIHFDVLVVGAGPAGASAAAFLVQNGITKVLVVNKAGSTADTPRAHITNAAALECMRDLGLEEACLAIATPKDKMLSTRFVDTFLGEEYARLHSWGNDPLYSGDYARASPCGHVDLPQTLLEPLLVTYATTRGATSRFNTELLSFEQDAEGVTSHLRDFVTGIEYDVRSKYLIGADGGRSKVVEALGIPLDIAPAGAACANVHFEADLSTWMPPRIANLTYIYKLGHPAPSWSAIGILRAVKTWSEWIMILLPKADAPRTTVTDEEYLERTRELIGDDCPPLRLIGTSIWIVRETVATSFGSGRVFCAGDAVHRHPPFNGLGSNTSLQDSYNLAWKLAFVLKGIAAPSLLESYSDERQPVGAGVIKRANDGFRAHIRLQQALGIVPTAETVDTSEEAMLKSASQAKRELAEATAEGTARRGAFMAALEDCKLEFSGLGIEMNQRYTSSAVYLADQGPSPALPAHTVLTHIPSTYPGSRLPHVWLSTPIPSKRVSTHDICGNGAFTLLIGPLGSSWREACDAVRSSLPGLPLRCAAIGPGQERTDVYGDWRTVCGIEEDGCVLVRPDRVVAWRSKSVTANAAADLIKVLKVVLSL